MYTKITLHGGGTYVQPLDQLAALVEELQNGEPGDTWTIVLLEMTAAEYKELPEFAGH